MARASSFAVVFSVACFSPATELGRFLLKESQPPPLAPWLDISLLVFVSSTRPQPPRLNAFTFSMCSARLICANNVSLRVSISRPNFHNSSPCAINLSLLVSMRHWNISIVPRNTCSLIFHLPLGHALWDGGFSVAFREVGLATTVSVPSLFVVKRSPRTTKYWP